MEKKTVQRGTGETLLMFSSPKSSRKESRAHASRQEIEKLLWNSVIASAPFPDWKAYYSADAVSRRRASSPTIQEVHLEERMLACGLPAIVLLTETGEPFFRNILLQPLPPAILAGGLLPETLAFPYHHPLRLAGDSTQFTYLDVKPPGHNSTTAWMRSTFSRERKTPYAKQSALLLVDPLGQKSVELRITHKKKDTGRSLALTLKGQTLPRNPDSLYVQTRIRLQDGNGNQLQYIFDSSGRLRIIEDTRGHSLPVEDIHAFARRSLGLSGHGELAIHPDQTLRSLWLSTGRKTPVNPLSALVHKKPVGEKVKAEVIAGEN